MKPRKFAAVVSAKSRTGELAFRTVEDLLSGHALFVRLARSVEQQAAAIERALDLGCTEIWVGGGDGSVRLAADQLAGSSAALAILPLGTGNSLARELEIPLELAEAVRFHLDEAEIRPIDVGTFGGDTFVNVATIGLTSRIVDTVKNSKKGKFGRLVYLPALFRAFQTAKAFSLKVETPDGFFVGRALQFVAASTRLHGGPFAVTENASIDDGKLSIYVVRSGDRRALFRYGWALLRGRHTELPNVWSLNTDRARVQLKHRGKFVIDGEPIVAQEAEIGIRERALLVSARPLGPENAP